MPVDDNGQRSEAATPVIQSIVSENYTQGPRSAEAQCCHEAPSGMHSENCPTRADEEEPPVMFADEVHETLETWGLEGTDAEIGAIKDAFTYGTSWPRKRRRERAPHVADIDNRTEAALAAETDNASPAIGSQVRICDGPHTGATGRLDFIDHAGGRALVDCGGGRNAGLTWARLEWVR